MNAFTTLISEHLKRSFTFDVRSIALARTFFGLLLLCDFYNIALRMEFYTSDQGLYSTEFFDRYYQQNGFSMSLFSFGYSSLFIKTGLVAGAISSILIMLNKWGRPNLVFIWILFGSFNSQHYIYNYVGDNLRLIGLIFFFLISFQPEERADHKKPMVLSILLSSFRFLSFIFSVFILSF